jgi:hypothetical protein
MTSSNNLLAYRPRFANYHSSDLAGAFINMEGGFHAFSHSLLTISSAKSFPTRRMILEVERLWLVLLILVIIFVYSALTVIFRPTQLLSKIVLTSKLHVFRYATASSLPAIYQEQPACKNIHWLCWFIYSNKRNILPAKISRSTVAMSLPPSWIRPKPNVQIFLPILLKLLLFFTSQNFQLKLNDHRHHIWSLY